MSANNLSAVLYKKGDLRLENYPIKEPGSGEAQIAVQRSGVCGSDVKFWKDGAIGPFKVTNPILLGHEISGIITKLGEGVTHLKIGDRVAVDPHITCRMCEFCKSGRYNMCPSTSFLATPPYDGALTRYFVHAADFIFKLPENVNFDEGAFVEPLSVGLHACRRAGVTLGHKILVTGAGPIGLCVILIAKALGVTAVCITDIDASRLEFAKKFGVTHTLLVKPGDKEEDLAFKVADLLGVMPDRTIECSGAEFAVNLGIHATKQGGQVVLIGAGQSTISFPVLTALTKEIDVKTSFRYVNTWPTVIDMLSCGKIDVKPMITHRYTLEQSLEAFEMAKSGQGVKVMIDCGH